MLTKEQIEDLDNHFAAKIKRAHEQYGGDQEVVHITGDQLLCDLLIALGCKETVAEWVELPKWYA